MAKGCQGSVQGVGGGWSTLQGIVMASLGPCGSKHKLAGSRHAGDTESWLRAGGGAAPSQCPLPSLGLRASRGWSLGFCWSSHLWGQDSPKARGWSCRLGEGGSARAGLTRTWGNRSIVSLVSPRLMGSGC